MSSPEEWFRELPVVTKYYFCAAVLSTMATSFGLLNPYYLILDFNLVFSRFQVWRLLTCFIWFGNFGMPWLFQMFILVRYCEYLEKGYYNYGPRGTADMVMVCGFCMSVILSIAFLKGDMMMLGPALIFAVLYIWARKDPYRQVSMWGFAFKAWHFPFVLLLVGILMGGSPVLNIIGICVGHLFHFLMDVLPTTHRKTLLWTPEFLYDLFEKRAVGAPSNNWNSGPGYRM
jgi:Derlin-2/3